MIPGKEKNEDKVPTLEKLVRRRGKLVNREKNQDASQIKVKAGRPKESICIKRGMSSGSITLGKDYKRRKGIVQN